MDESIKSVLTTRLLRILRDDKKLTLDEGVADLVSIAQNVELLTNDEAIITTALEPTRGKIRRHGVLNPQWLASEKGMKLYFYFVNAQPGWLRPLVKKAESLVGCSYYILYGAMDLLIVMHGSSEDAGALQKEISDSEYYDLAYLSANEIPLFYGNTPLSSDWKTAQLNVESDIINRLVDNYDEEALESEKKQLERANVLLGSRWELEMLSEENPDFTRDVGAIVGIRLGRGYRALDPIDVLKAMQKNKVLKASLVQLVETDSGYPFNYVAKLVCSNREELDQATDAIAYCRVGAVPLEGITFIIARGQQAFPTLKSKIIDQGPSPDLSQIDDAARKMLIGLGAETTVAFSKLDLMTKVKVLAGLDDLTNQIQNQNWGEASDARIQAAFGLFARASIEGVRPGSMVGAVMLLATAVEETVQTAIRLILEAVYEKDFRRAQDELKLPTKIISKLTLGKAVMALRTMKAHQDFGFVGEALDDKWLKRLERFAEARNIWAHTGVAVGGTPDAMIDEARRGLVEGIELIRWVHSDILTAYEKHVKAKTVPERHIEIKLKPSRREFGIFLSHSSKDATVAKRIAEGLRAMNYPVWYADWAIAPSQSIVDKINEALARSDTLIVLLSENSVKSKWVERELNTALMSQLSGEGVTVIPVLIADCEIPVTLRAVRYIDMRADAFQKGFIQMLEFFQTRRG